MFIQREKRRSDQPLNANVMIAPATATPPVAITTIKVLNLEFTSARSWFTESVRSPTRVSKLSKRSFKVADSLFQCRHVQILATNVDRRFAGMFAHINILAQIYDYQESVSLHTRYLFRHSCEGRRFSGRNVHP